MIDIQTQTCEKYILRASESDIVIVLVSLLFDDLQPLLQRAICKDALEMPFISIKGLLCYSIVLRAQFVAGNYFVSDVMVKYFYNLPYNKAVLYKSLIILPDSYCI